MKSKKILLASIIGCAMAVSACTPKASSSVQGSSPAANPLAGEYNVTLWVSELEGVAAQFESQIDAFEAANPGVVITPTIEGITEADSATKMLSDVDAGADIYCFAQDQFARLVQGNALSKLGQGAAQIVKESNDAGSVGAVTSGTDIYAYPLTSDNGYFMYYDKSVVKETSVDSLEAIIADCQAAGRKFSFETETNAWYTAGWFFGTGCDSVWTTNSEGKFVDVVDDFNSDKGLIAVKGMKKLVSSDVFVNSSNAADFDAAIPSAVVVSGTWNYSVALEALGENLGVVDLPSFEVDGQSYHIGSYSGNKLLGVKPQADATRAAVLHKLAQYLTGETAQEERCVEFGWGPSNKAVQGKECVTSNPALAALGQQNNYAKPQGQINGAWWDVAGVIGTDVKAATDEAGLKAALEKYETSLRGIFTAVQNWGLVGSMDGSGWKTNIDLTEQEDGSWTLTYTLNAEDQFKFRIAGDWETALGASAAVVDTAIADNFDLTTSTDGNIICKVAGTYNFKVVPSESKVYISQ